MATGSGIRQNFAGFLQLHAAFWRMRLRVAEFARIPRASYSFTPHSGECGYGECGYGACQENRILTRLLSLHRVGQAERAPRGANPVVLDLRRGLADARRPGAR